MIRITIPARWRQIQRAFGGAAVTTAMRSCNHASSENARRLLLKTGLAEQDPYGATWAERKYDYPHPILRQTGAMLRTTVARSSPRSWSIQYGHKRSLWHHYGTGIYGKRRRRIKPVHATMLRWQHGGRTVFARSVEGVQKRPLVPQASRGWPQEWRRMLEATWGDVFPRELLGRG